MPPASRPLFPRCMPNLPRWVAACGIAFLTFGNTPAQPGTLPDSANPVARPFAGSPPATTLSDCDLPPLLPVPQPGQTPPGLPTPRGPGGEYDPGYFYLPDRVPDTLPASSQACGPAGRFWISSMLELGWTNSAHAPALLRVGSPTGPVAYGDGGLSTPFRAGVGVTGGVWLNSDHTHGIDASFDYLAPGNTNMVIFSNGSAFYLPTAGGGAYTLANPATGYAGAYQAGLTTRFAAADVNYRENLFCDSSGRLDAMVGYRYGHLGEDYTIYGKRIGEDIAIERFRDDISALNQFHGGQIGLAGEYRVGRWFLSTTAKMAFGAVFTDTEANGKFRVNGVVMPYGFYSRPGENGSREETRFGVMPTTALTFGRQIGKHGRVFIGYNFLYMNNLVRGPDVIDPTPPVTGSNPFQVNPANPSRRDATTSDLWVQTLNLGLEWRF